MKQESSKKARLLILASGQGSLFFSIVQACKSGHLNAEVIGLLSDNNKALVLKKAHAERITIKILKPKNFISFSKWDEALYNYLRERKPDWILLAGFLKKIGPKVLSAFKNRVLNIHPSLLPHHGGAGMYGIHVHRAVITGKDKKTGISVHLVSEEYDTGPVLAQKELLVFKNDTPESLQKRVKATEQTFYVSVLQKIITGEICISE